MRLVRRKDGSAGPRMRTREEELERRYQQEGFSLTLDAHLAHRAGRSHRGARHRLADGGHALRLRGRQRDAGHHPGVVLGRAARSGLISPGRTFIEPVVASFCAAIPTVFYLVRSQTVRTMPTFMYVIMAAIGVLFTLIGSYIGERIQLGPPPKPAD